MNFNELDDGELSGMNRLMDYHANRALINGLKQYIHEQADNSGTNHDVTGYDFL